MKEFETTKQNKQKCIKHDITMQMGKHGRRIIIRFYFKLLLTMQGTFEYLVFFRESSAICIFSTWFWIYII